MAKSANVASIDCIRAFRADLVKFIEKVRAAASEAEADLHKTLNWIERDQSVYWTGQIRKRQETLSRAQEALRMKKLFRQADGSFPSAVDEEKAVRVARMRLEEADYKTKRVAVWSRRLPTEFQLFKGGIQGLMNQLFGDLPRAVMHLEQMAATLESYVALAPAGSVADVAAPAIAADGMGRSPTEAASNTPPMTQRQIAVRPLPASDGGTPAASEPAPVIFDALGPAQEYAAMMLRQNPALRLELLDHTGKVLLTIDAGGIA